MRFCSKIQCTTNIFLATQYKYLKCDNVFCKIIKFTQFTRFSQFRLIFSITHLLAYRACRCDQTAKKNIRRIQHVRGVRGVLIIAYRTSAFFFILCIEIDSQITIGQYKYNYHLNTLLPKLLTFRSFYSKYQVSIKSSCAWNRSLRQIPGPFHTEN